MKPSEGMSRLREPGSVRRRVRSWRRAGEKIAFVPTMGFLHEGHLSLVRRARRLGDRVVVSVFVNPAQFGPREDFRTYPRDTRRDLRLLREEGVDLVFLPATATMYPPGHRTTIDVGGLDSVLEGRSRPGHFRGVVLVVEKLLNIVEPDLLVLGQKDAQQAVILERMVRDLDQPVRVVRGPTVREKDGLALSSRNTYLDPAQRRAAPVLYRALSRARAAARRGERSAARLLRLIEREIAGEPLVRLDYAAVVDPATLAPVRKVEGKVLIPLAAFLGRTRLIDNLEVTPGRAR